MAISYTKKMLVERVRLHVANNFPSDENTLSENQTILYVDQALAFNMVGQVYAGAKLEGFLEVPEGYVTTYSLQLLKEEHTGKWVGTLPHPPVSLPIQIGVPDIYLASSADGQSESIPIIRTRRRSYRRHMPSPHGCIAEIDGRNIYIIPYNGESLLGKTLYVKMAKTRTENINEELNIPDDAIEGIFAIVIKKIAERFTFPQDVVKDDVPAGNKAS